MSRFVCRKRSHFGTLVSIHLQRRAPALRAMPTANPTDLAATNK